jgi:hypothetical protein
MVAASNACSTPRCNDPADPADGASSTDASQSDLLPGVPTGPVTTIPLAGCGGPGYAASFNIGSQTFQLTLDTGSGTLAVASSSCSTCGVSPLYTPGSSATDDHLQASDSYLQGSWTSEVFSDSVQLVGTGPVTMKLAAIESQTNFFSDLGCELGAVNFAPQGIVGFGPPSLAVKNTTSFISELGSIGAASQVFAVEFCEQGGQLMIGGVDVAAAAIAGPAVFTPMTTSQYYDVTLNDLQLGGASLGFDAAAFGTTAVDTGTSVLALPSAVFTALTTQLENNATFKATFGADPSWLNTTTCLSASASREDLDMQLPPLSLVFPSPDGGAAEVTLPATQSYLQATPVGESTLYCSGVLSNPNSTGTILGTSVMIGQLVIFDLATNEVGFAPQTHCQ